MTTVKTKKPAIINIALNLLFIWLGIRNLQKAAAQSNKALLLFFSIIGLLCITGFALLFILSLRRYFNKESGLVFTEDQLTIKHSSTAFVTIPWDDIKEIRLETRKNLRCILPILTNPEQPIDEQNGFLKKVMQSQYRQFDTPVPVLAEKYETAYTILVKLFEQYAPVQIVQAE